MKFIQDTLGHCTEQDIENFKSTLLKHFYSRYRNRMLSLADSLHEFSNVFEEVEINLSHSNTEIYTAVDKPEECQEAFHDAVQYLEDYVIDTLTRMTTRLRNEGAIKLPARVFTEVMKQISPNTSIADLTVILRMVGQPYVTLPTTLEELVRSSTTE